MSDEIRPLTSVADAGGTRSVWLRRDDAGRLFVEGQDLGRGVEHLLGGDEYEWSARIRAAPEDGGHRIREELGLGDGDLLYELEAWSRLNGGFHLHQQLKAADLVDGFWSRVG